MSFNHLKYGVLSNYDFFFFFKRNLHQSNQKSSLSISRCISRAEIISVFLSFMILIRKDFFYSSPKGSPLIKTIKQKNKYEMIDLKSENFRFNECISCSNFGSIIRGRISNRSEKVIFKVSNIEKQHAYEKLESELKVYRYLENLQGIFIPRFYGIVNFNGVCR
jgi:hypothetical protein